MVFVHIFFLGKAGEVVVLGGVSVLENVERMQRKQKKKVCFGGLGVHALQQETGW